MRFSKRNLQKASYKGAIIYSFPKHLYQGFYSWTIKSLFIRSNFIHVNFFFHFLVKKRIDWKTRKSLNPTVQKLDNNKIYVDEIFVPVPVGRPRTCTSKRRYFDVQFGRSYNVRRTSFSVRPEDVLLKTLLWRLLFVFFSRSAQKTSKRRPFCTCSGRTL